MKKTLRGDRQIGQKIKATRKRLGLSQMTLGEMVGVTYQQIQKYEKGEDRITVERLRLIAKALRLPVTVLLLDGHPVIQETSSVYRRLGDLSEEEMALVQSFRKIRNRAYRQQILSMITLGDRIVVRKKP